MSVLEYWVASKPTEVQTLREFPNSLQSLGQMECNSSCTTREVSDLGFHESISRSEVSLQRWCLPHMRHVCFLLTWWISPLEGMVLGGNPPRKTAATCSFHPRQARAMDPQQRLLLESSLNSSLERHSQQLPISGIFPSYCGILRYCRSCEYWYVPK